MIDKLDRCYNEVLYVDVMVVFLLFERHVEVPCQTLAST